MGENTETIALLTHTSMGPSSRSIKSVALSTARASATSTGIASACAPAASTSLAAASSPSWSRANSATPSPRAAKARAAARPTPALAPVMTTVAMWSCVPSGEWVEPWGVERSRVRDAHAAPARRRVELGPILVGADSLEKTREVGAVHPAHQLGLFLREGMERTVVQGDAVAIDVGFVALSRERLDDGRDVVAPTTVPVAGADVASGIGRNMVDFRRD